MKTDPAAAAVEALERFPDEFRGDDAHLVQCIEALLSIDAKDALAPHGIGDHARGLLSASMHRLARNVERAMVAGAVPVAGVMILGPNTEADWTEYGHSLPPGTKLYAHAPPAVPVESLGRDAEFASDLDAALRARGLPMVANALGYSRNFAAANPHLTQTAKDHINGLCDMLEIAAGQHAPPPASVPDGLRPAGFNESAHVTVMTYTSQPGNVEAWRLGEACARVNPGGDYIDGGLSLLRELHARGYGIVRVPAHPTTPEESP